MPAESISQSLYGWQLIGQAEPEPQSFEVKHESGKDSPPYRPTEGETPGIAGHYAATYIAKITIAPRLRLQKKPDTLVVDLSPPRVTKEVLREDEGGLLDLGWQYALAEIENPYYPIKELRAVFDVGKPLALQSWGNQYEVQLPRGATQLLRIELDYQWQENQKTLVFEHIAKLFPEEPIEVRWAVEEVLVWEDDAGNGIVDAIVSAQALSRSDPLPFQYMQFRFLKESQAKEENITLLRVAGSLEEAKREAKGPMDIYYPIFGDYWGKGYCRLRFTVPTTDDLLLGKPIGEGLIGLQVLIGEPVPNQPLPTVMGGENSPVEANLTKEKNIFVKAKEALVQTVANNTFNVAMKIQSAVAALPDKKTVFRWVYDRMLDQLSRSMQVFNAARVALGLSEEEGRACLGGYLLGTIKGVYNNVSGTIEDIKTFAVDLPVAFVRFIAKEAVERTKKDPAIIIKLYTVGAPHVVAEYSIEKGQEAYAFMLRNEEALKKMLADVAIGYAFDKAAGKTSIVTFSDIFKLATSAFYNHFENKLEPILTWLSYRKQSNEYNFYITSFIIGDIVGYAVVELTAQAALAICTEGAGNVLRVMTKMGGLAGKVAGITASLAETIEKILKLVVSVVSKAKGFFIAKTGAVATVFTHVESALGKGINGVANFFAGIARFLVKVEEKALEGFFRFLRESGDALGDFFRFALHFVYDLADMSRIAQVWEAVFEVIKWINAKLAEIAGKTLRALAKLAENTNGAITRGMAFAGEPLKKAVKGCTMIIGLVSDAMFMELTADAHTEVDAGDIESFTETLWLEAEDFTEDELNAIQEEEGEQVDRIQVLRESLQGMWMSLRDFKGESYAGI